MMPFSQRDAINIIRALYDYHFFNMGGQLESKATLSKELESECLEFFDIDDSDGVVIHGTKELVAVSDALDAKIIGFLMGQKQSA